MIVGPLLHIRKTKEYKSLNIGIVGERRFMINVWIPYHKIDIQDVEEVNYLNYALCYENCGIIKILK